MPRGRDRAGAVVLGALAYITFVAYLRDGAAGLTGLWRAKFLNQPQPVKG